MRSFLKIPLLVLVLFLIPVSAQKLKINGRLNKPANTAFVIECAIATEGSYRLERADILNSNVWTTVTNFTAVPGTIAISQPVGGSSRFYRLLQLTNPPAITLQPVGVTNYAPSEVRLLTSVAGSAPLNFRWYRDGRAIDGAIGANLIFNGRADLSGNYSLVATNPWGSVTSSAVSVKIQNAVAPTISGKSIRFVITGLQGDFFTPGEYTTTFNPLGFYNATSSSFELVDAGNWGYSILNEGTARVTLAGSIVYQDALVTLSFQNPASGVYVLVSTRFNGAQSGHFEILN